jgi:hypothetical protein
MLRPHAAGARALGYLDDDVRVAGARLDVLGGLLGA